MSELEAQPSLISASVDEPAVAVSPTAGSLLREARLAAGAHLESIAFSLKVPVAKIDALERDDASVFPDVAFMRALASSVCRILHVESAPVLALMPKSTPHSLGSFRESSRPKFRQASSGGSSPKRAGSSSRWLVAAVVVLLLGAAAVAFTPRDWGLPGFPGSGSSPQAEAVSVMPADAASADAGVNADVNADVKADVKAGNDADTGAANLVTGSTFSMADSPVLVGAGASAHREPLSASEPTEPQMQAPATPRLAFNARGDTWIRVMDKGGKVLLERNLTKGDSVSVNDPGVLSVVVGRADVTDVRVGANARDITSYTRNNVARFEVQE